MRPFLTISLGNQSLEIGEISRKHSDIVVKRLIEKEIPQGMMDNGTVLDEEAAAKMIASVLKESNIKTKRVIFIVPSGRVMAKEIILPKMKEEKIAETLKTNAEDYFPLPAEDYAFSYFKISSILEEKGEKQRKGKKREKLRLMALAAPDEMIRSYYRVADLAKLKVAALDYVGNSIFQALSSQIGEEACLVVQMREDSTTFTVFAGGTMMLQRHIGWGAADTAGERILSGMERVIEYYRGKYGNMPLTAVYFAGKESKRMDLPGMMEKKSGLPVHMLSTMKQVTICPSVGLDAAAVMEHMEQIGAVIRPVGFLPKAMEQDLRRRLEAKAWRILMLLSVLAGLLIITLPAMEFFDLSFEKMDLEARLMSCQDLDRLYADYERAELEYQDRKAVEEAVSTNNEKLPAFIETFERICPDGMEVTTFSCEEGQVTFLAEADRKEAVIEILTKLKAAAGIFDVDISGITSSYDEEGKESATFSVTLRLEEEKNRTAEEEREEEKDEPR